MDLLEEAKKAGFDVGVKVSVVNYNRKEQYVSTIEAMFLSNELDERGGISAVCAKERRAANGALFVVIEFENKISRNTTQIPLFAKYSVPNVVITLKKPDEVLKEEITKLINNL